MYHYPSLTPFTAEEDWEFRELSFQRSREGQLDFVKNGVPMTARHRLWLQEQERLRVLSQSYLSQQNRALPSLEELPPRLQALPSNPTPVNSSLSVPLEASSSSSNTGDGNASGLQTRQETQLQESPPKSPPMNVSGYSSDENAYAETY